MTVLAEHKMVVEKRVNKKEGTIDQDTKDYKKLNEWNEHGIEATQMNCTYIFFNESYILKDDGEKSVFQKILSLYKDLDERLYTNHVKSFTNPYGEHNDISSVFIELKTHSLVFTMEQLYHYTMLKYIIHAENTTSWKVVWYIVQCCAALV
jgi:hypothetical protein